jgi:integrase
MSISKKFSEKHGRKMWGFDIRVADGNRHKKRVRRYECETRDEAEKVVQAIRKAEREARYGIAPMANRPRLQDLIAKRLPIIAAKAERTRARRVLYTWLKILDPAVKLGPKFEPKEGQRSPVKVDEIKTASIRKYVELRLNDGQAPSSINRELSIIGATLNQAGEHFSELEQWKPPKMPKLKVGKSRRERLVTNDEYRQLIDHLRRPPDVTEGRRPQDQRNAYRGRVRVAQIFEFAMMSAARHSEIVKLKWTDVDWEREKVLIWQNKTGQHKEIPLITGLAAVIKEREPAKGIYVFSKGGNISPKFYKILRKACEDLGIPYGKNREDGLILHTARHTVTTHLVEAGLDYDTIGLITGHKAKELIAHYSHKHPGSVARAAAALDQISAKREQKAEKK